MGGNSNLDIVYVMVVVLTAVFGPRMAGVVGPYAVVVLASIGGAAWSVGRRPLANRTPWNDLLFFARLTITALIVTGGLSVYAERWTGDGTRQWTLPIIALAIGAIGDDWTKVGTWFASFVRGWATRKTDTKDSPDERSL